MGKFNIHTHHSANNNNNSSSNDIIWNVYCAPISIFNTSHALSHLISTTTVRKRCQCFQFTDKENTVFGKSKDIQDIKW